MPRKSEVIEFVVRDSYSGLYVILQQGVRNVKWSAVAVFVCGFGPDVNVNNRSREFRREGARWFPSSLCERWCVRGRSSAMLTSFRRRGRAGWWPEAANPAAFKEVVNDHPPGNADVCERTVGAKRAVTSLYRRPVINVVNKFKLYYKL